MVRGMNMIKMHCVHVWNSEQKYKTCLESTSKTYNEWSTNGTLFHFYYLTQKCFSNPFKGS